MSDSKLSIGFAQWTYDKDFSETMQCIERVSPNVDVTIINYSYNNSMNNNDINNINWLNTNEEKYNLKIITNKFNDNFPEQRNKYIEEARKLNVNWLCVSDPDECYSEELASNLRKLITKFDSDGYSILSVPCKDQFDAVEWLDRLDLLKECPMGYRETDFWKPMLIFKVFDDIHYEGVGVEANVHETLVTRYKLTSINLPKQYFYVHKKSSLKIWRNAARNFFIGGGGDNVGSKNRLWTDLKLICSQMKINTWNEFENLIEKGINSEEIIQKHLIIENETQYKLNDKLQEEFKLWLESALKASPTKEGVETRETAKWYFALHKNEITPRIKDLIDKVADISEEIEVENFVTQSYYQILGRHPDETGKHHYTQSILNKKIKRSELIDILRSSDEYKQKFKTSDTQDFSNIIINDDFLLEYDKEEYEKIEKFVNNAYIKILGRPADIPGKNNYIKLILDKKIKPSNLVDILKNSVEGRSISGSKGIVGLMRKQIPSSGGIIQLNANKAALKYEKIDTSHNNTVALCIMGYSKGVPLIKQSIETIGNNVDEIHVQGDNFTEEDITTLKSANSKTQIHIEKWNDDFSEYKNKAISHANTEWVLILDHDEVPTEELSRELKNIIKSSDRGNNYDMVSFDVIDIRTVNNKQISQNRSKGGKALLHWNIPNPYYGNPHIWLKQNYYPWKQTHSNIAYNHIKDIDSDLQRSVRNVFMGGGGDNSKEKNPLWIELRKLCSEFGINDYKAFDNCLRCQHIDNRLIDIIVRMSEMQWKDNELKDILRYYKLLHPDKKLT